jgi:predicted O-methyltransferase YrrM
MLRDALIRGRRAVLDPLAWQLSRRELHGLMKDTSVAGVVEATDRYVGRGFYASIHAVQRRSEIMALAELVQASHPKVIMEIGTCKGGTLYIWSRINPDAELIVSLDLPEKLGGYRARRRKLYEEFAYDRRPGTIRLLQRDSHATSTLEELKEILGGRPIDFLWIDADHSYEGAKRDYEMYSPLVRHGGLVAFHDIATRAKGAAVYRLWAELKTCHECREFQELRDYMGVGVVNVD